MTEEEFRNAVNEIERERDRKLKELRLKCAKSNQRYNIGDIIEDSIGRRILIDKLYISSDFYRPEIYYSGLTLTKKGVPNKRNDRISVFNDGSVLIKRADDKE